MLFPHVESKRVLLRPATAEDGPKVYEILFQSGRSTLPTLEVFLQNFSRGVAAQFLVQRRDSDHVVGFSSLSELTPAGHVQAAVHTDAEQSEGISADAAALTVNFAFAMWRIRKVYFQTHEADLTGLGFTGEYASAVRQEAVLPDHLYFQGKLWDMYVHAIYREEWDVQGTELLKGIV
ncbi:GNAT family N-acetyltransferase [Amycolatopsis anabasis]|uniref:GNAT family N-acetyltransferase n=1 Tax=Amycolatopsis anabasis TaxID=1840409 RepID=UPI001C55180F|nr:GNAT family protein [Amycolatopsis anabasis]